MESFFVQNGGISNTRENAERQFPLVPQSVLGHRGGSYVLRRSQDTPPPQTGAMRDSRSCTPPRNPTTNQQFMKPPMATMGSVTRPQTLDVHSMMHHRSPSPIAQHRLSTASADGAQSCPGTPTGSVPSAPRTSIGIGIPSLKIYQNGSQIMLTPQPNSPTLVVSSQSGVGGKPVYFQYQRAASQGPQSGLVGVSSPSTWQYVRRPSYADVELAVSILIAFDF